MSGAVDTRHMGDEPVYTCVTCNIAYFSAHEQREHFRSDLHRYNMKRRVTDLAPVSAATFNDKVQERRAVLAQAQEPGQSGKCQVCNKLFSSQNAYRDHMQSKKHKEMEKKRANAPKRPDAPPRTAPPIEGTEQEGEHMDDETSMEQSMEQKIARARRIDPSAECLCCGVQQSSLEDNVAHMQSAHGFFLPERKYLVDPAGLMQYLADKVSVGNVCLWCNGKGRSFHDLESIRKHMLDKSHCKVAYDTQEDQLELSDFYDFRASYPDYQGSDWEDADDDAKPGDEMWVPDQEDEERLPDNNVRYGDSELELVLPSGARLGHRSLQRYYRQTLWQTPAAQTNANSGRALAHRLAGTHTAPSNLVVTSRGGNQVVARNHGEAKEANRHIREFRDQKRREQYKTKIGFRNNNQKHFRDQLLQ